MVWRGWAGGTRPSELWLRAGGRRDFDPERASGRDDESRIHDCFVRGALIADHQGFSPTLDERLVGAVRCDLATRVVCGDLAGLDDHNHDARMEVPARAALRLEDDRLDQDIRRILGLELDPILVHLDAVRNPNRANGPTHPP